MLFKFKTYHYNGFKIDIICKPGAHVPEAVISLLDVFFNKKLNLMVEWIPERIYLENKKSSIIKPLKLFKTIKVDVGFFCAELDDWNQLVIFTMCLTKNGFKNVSQDRIQLFSDEIGEHLKRQF